MQAFPQPYLPYFARKACLLLAERTFSLLVEELVEHVLLVTIS